MARRKSTHAAGSGKASQRARLVTLNELRRRFPNSSDAFLRRNREGISAIVQFRDSELRAAKPKPTEGDALERPAPGKDSGRFVTSPRHRIRFTIYSVRPCDWDGYHIKELQDMLIRASIIPDDNWGFLQGEVVSEKALSKAEEKTVIEITPCP